MTWQYQYLEAIEVAAAAGDAESQWLVADACADRYSFGSSKPGTYEIYGADHYATEYKYLQAACKVRHPLAQKRLGALLFKGNIERPPERWRGASLWMSGLLGAGRYQPAPLNKRLLGLTSKKSPEIRLDGTRSKLLYLQNNRKDHASCGVRISYVSAEECQVVIEFLPMMSVPSVTNVAERLATIILYRLLMDGVDLDPQKIQWFEAYPTDASMRDEGTLKKLEFEWSGAVYRSPRWLFCTKNDLRIDLNDILK